MLSQCRLAMPVYFLKDFVEKHFFVEPWISARRATRARRKRGECFAPCAFAQLRAKMFENNAPRPGLVPNCVHRTRTSVQAEHVHRTCSGGVWPNKRSDKPNKCSDGLGTFTFKQNHAQRNPNKRSDNPNMFSRTRSDSNTEQNTKHEQVFSNTRTAFSSSPAMIFATATMSAV